MGLIRDILIFFGILAVIIGLLGMVIGFALLLTKALGVLLILAGLFLIFWFPDISKYQPAGMTKSGVLIGVILLIAGLAVIDIFPMIFLGVLVVIIVAIIILMRYTS